jgi:hypothetical protein
VVKFNIEHRKNQLPACLTAGQLLRGAEIKKILMISEHNDWVRVPFEVMMPFSERADNSEQLPIEDLVVSFCRVQGLG